MANSAVSAFVETARRAAASGALRR